MRKLFTLCLLIVSLSATAQWQQTGSKVRYVNGLGIPTRDTVAGVAADSSQIVIRPADSSLYVKYKRTWVKVGGGTVSGTTNYIPKFTSSTAIGNSQIFDNGTGVGIGTASPSAKLDVVGGNILGGDGTVKTGISYAGTLGILGTLSNHNLGVFTNSLERMRITSGGNALIGTTADNGVDRLQVSGSGYFNGNGLLGKFDGTSTNNAYIDFRTSGTAKWQLGNNASTSHSFNLTNSATSVNSMVVNSSNQIGFNMQGAFNSTAFEWHKTSSQFQNRFYTWDATGLGINFLFFSSRSNTYGTNSATLSGDPLFQWNILGSTNTAHVYGSEMYYIQDGATTSSAAPGYLTFASAGSSTTGRTKLRIDGASDYIGFYTSSSGFNSYAGEKLRITSSGRVLMGSTLPTDNTVDALQVNGSISGIGFKQAYVTKTGAYTATDADYVIDCTSGTFTVTLPASSGRTGRILIIKNSGAGTITVDGNAAETIDGAATYAISVQYGTVQIMSDGTNWKIIAKF